MARHSAPTSTRTEPDARDTGTYQEVQQFLDRFAKALTRGDTAAVVALWEPPALVLGDDDVRSISSNEEIAMLFAGAKQRYNDQGIVDTRGEIVTLRWPTERIATVEVRWPYLDAQGHELGAETSTYTLRRDDDGELRLRAALMHGVEAPQRRTHH